MGKPWRTLLVRIWQGEDNSLQGQLVDPHDDRRTPFGSPDVLWQLLVEAVTRNPPEQIPSHLFLHSSVLHSEKGFIPEDAVEDEKNRRLR